MEFITGLAIGAICGALVIGVISGASRVNREREIYMEGFLAGQEEKQYEKN